MDIHVKEVSTGTIVPARIVVAELDDMPLKKDGWNFNWRNLWKAKDAQFYELRLSVSPEKVEGMLMVSVIGGEMVYMNNLELAPHNIGKSGKFDFVAGSLIAFACRLSFIHGKGHYTGFLSFESKTALINHYREKYGATWAMGQKMFIDPQAGKRLIEKYLNLQD